MVSTILVLATSLPVGENYPILFENAFDHERAVEFGLQKVGGLMHYFG
jgi:hypothetical protein